MENKNSSNHRATIYGFITFSERSRDEDNNLNSSLNQPFPSSSVSSPNEIDTSILSSSSNRSTTDMCIVNPIKSCLNSENSLPISSSKGCPSMKYI